MRNSARRFLPCRADRPNGLGQREDAACVFGRRLKWQRCAAVRRSGECLRPLVSDGGRCLADLRATRPGFGGHLAVVVAQGVRASVQRPRAGAPIAYQTAVAATGSYKTRSGRPGMRGVAGAVHRAVCGQAACGPSRAAGGELLSRHLNPRRGRRLTWARGARRLQGRLAGGAALLWLRLVRWPASDGGRRRGVARALAGRRLGLRDRGAG